MEYVWSEYEGQVAGSHPLQSFLGARHGRAFFLTEHEGSPALLQVLPSSPAQHEMWREALHLSHPHLMQLYTMGEATLDELPITYAVGQLPDDDLSEILPKRTLNDAETQQVSEAVNAALDYLHGRNLASGAVTPDNIFAVGDLIKLGVDQLQPGGDLRGDRRQLEATLIEVRTGTRPAPKPLAPSIDVAKPVLVAEAPVRLPIAKPAAIPEPIKDSESSSAFPKHWIWAGSALTAAALMVWATHREPVNASLPAAAPVTVAPSPGSQRTAQAPAAPAVASVVWEGHAVIAAEYRSAAAAEGKADEIRRRWPKFHPKVVAVSGNRYLIALGSGMSKKEAKHLQGRARSAGIGRGVYVTSF